MGKVIGVIIVVLAIVGLVWLVKSNKNNGENAQTATTEQGSVAGVNTSSTLNSENNSDIVLFYGTTCPHCKKVEDFLKANDVMAKLPYQNLEVYNSKANQGTMVEKQNQCKDLSEDDKGGVPFLYTPDKCIVGDQPIIDWFSQKIGIK